EAKAAHIAASGLGRRDWVLSRIHAFGPLGSTASLASNWMVAHPAARWFLEKTLGIARRRKLPTFARRSFLRSAGRALLRTPHSNGAARPVVYFVSDYANYHDPQLAHAFVRVLEHNGVRVHVPPEQTGSGMSMISAGDLDAAREIALTNLRALAELARDGCEIVCTEPTAALCLKHEYPLLLDHPDAAPVAARTIEAGAYLERLHQQGRLKTDFQPLSLDAGYHLPCHLKALGGSSALLRLLALIPELRVHRIEQGCSGMAGAFGLLQENFRTSIRIGWGLISRMRDEDLTIGLTECSSCKIQMEQGTPKPTLHPIKLLALSYGLMPEIRQKLVPSKNRLVVT
ncbi:MAG: heterodisulfide reductase-related iron-sulfur binding cluster, partial [Planctomycetaceae bacterium]